MKHTVQVETDIINNNREVVKRVFTHYSAPTSPSMAASLAASLRRINRSYRIVADDGRGPIIDQWCREGWEPDDGLGIPKRREIITAHVVNP